MLEQTTLDVGCRCFCCSYKNDAEESNHSGSFCKVSFICRRQRAELRKSVLKSVDVPSVGFVRLGAFLLACRPLAG